MHPTIEKIAEQHIAEFLSKCSALIPPKDDQCRGGSGDPDHDFLLAYFSLLVAIAGDPRYCANSHAGGIVYALRARLQPGAAELLDIALNEARKVLIGNR